MQHSHGAGSKSCCRAEGRNRRAATTWPPVLRLIPALLVLTPSLTGSLTASHPVRFKKAMVVAQERVAADVGVDVLRTGGNAIDAAVAVAFALAVTHPSAGNIGGGGFLLAHFEDGRSTFLNFREKAPSGAGGDMYLDDEGKLTPDAWTGWRASAVPGTVKGMEHVHQRYGTRPWAEVLEPAIRLARQGFPLSRSLARSMERARRIKRSEDPEARRIFQRDGKLYQAGETFRQPELAATLSRIEKGGAREFYEGQTARLLVSAMEAAGGLITAADLRAYTVQEMDPLQGRYGGYRILTANLPSSGGFGLLQMLGMLEGSDYHRGGHGSASTLHYLAEVMRIYFADRNQFLADPDFRAVPLSDLLAPDYLARRRASIDRLRATPSTTLNPTEGDGPESPETTHFSIVDERGNAVSMTYTLNSSWGSGVVPPGLGFLLNNQMSDFHARPGHRGDDGLIPGEANAIEPEKRPLSSITTTIVLRGQRPWLVLGAPGGKSITTGVLQVILNVIDFGMNIQEALDRPRIHHQWRPDKLSVEPGISPDTQALLKQRGHELERFRWGADVVAIEVRNRELHGAVQPNRTGKVAGY